MKSRGFTLIELLVVVSILMILIVVLTPIMMNSLNLGRATRCATNIRNIGFAHMAYTQTHFGNMVNAGLSHGYPSEGKEQDAWINTLRRYYGSKLTVRSPLDKSPHWGPAPEGRRIPGAPKNQRRRTSYGINNMLADIDGDGYNPFGRPPRGFRNWPGGDGKAYPLPELGTQDSRRVF